MELEKLVAGNVVFVGVGNDLRRDDGVGVYIAKKLRRKNVVNAGVAPENFVGKIRKMKPESIVIFDSLDFGGRPGEVRIIEARKTDGLRISTHSLPLSFFSELFENVGIYLVGIQPKNNEFGSEMSSEVVKSANELVKSLAP